jgi:HSP20 family protein
MSTEITTKSHSKQPVIYRMSEGESLIRRVDDLFDTLNRRAYELFESRGCQDGHDLQDWFQAESELLGPMPVEISDADDELIVRADLPGFREKDIEVREEPHRLVITGKREQIREQQKRKTIYSDRKSDEVFRLVGLSEEVDPNRVKASLQDGILEVELPKAHPSRKIPVSTRAAQACVSTVGHTYLVVGTCWLNLKVPSDEVFTTRFRRIFVNP